MIFDHHWSRRCYTFLARHCISYHQVNFIRSVQLGYEGRSSKEVKGGDLQGVAAAWWFRSIGIENSNDTTFLDLPSLLGWDVVMLEWRNVESHLFKPWLRIM